MPTAQIEREVLFGPKKYFGKLGNPPFQSDSFTAQNPSLSPGRLVIENGNNEVIKFEKCPKPNLKNLKGYLQCKAQNTLKLCKQILTRVEWIEVELNGKRIVSKNGFNKSSKQLVLSVNLQASNLIKVRAHGFLTSYVTLKIDREGVANVAPIAEFSVTPGPVTNPLKYHFDATASSDSDGSIAAYRFDFGDGDQSDQSVVDHKFDSIGTYNVTLTVTDDKGAQNSKTILVNVEDVRAPELTLNSPIEGATFSTYSILVSGSSDEPLGSATANGDALAVSNGGLTFSGNYEASGDGPFTIEVVGTDESGNAQTITRHVVVQVVQNDPPVAQFNLSAQSGFAPILVLVDASASSDPDGQALTYAWDFGDGTTGTGVKLTHQYPNAGSYNIQLTVTDSLGLTATQSKSLNVNNPVLPPDPASVAPIINFQGASLTSDSLTFLFSGANPIQTGANLSAFDSFRISLVRGRVLNPSGIPVSGVSVSVIGQSQLGQTLSRADGHFDLAVNGGGTVRLRYERNGYFAVDRFIETIWQDMVIIDDVTMTPMDAKVTNVDLASSQMKVIAGSPVTDQRGTRTGALFVPGSVSATLVGGSHNGATLDNMAIRITEFTSGQSGRSAMPGELPPTSAYTYAMELSADEAMVASADRVDFSKPFFYYVNNFLNIPVGSRVPNGYYDRTVSMWKAEVDGLVIKIIGIQNGKAIVSADGTNPITSTQLQGLQFTDEELQNLASNYGLGAELWRSPIHHFSTYDQNFPWELSDNSPPPDPRIPPDDSGGDDPEPPKECASIIEIETQVLGENIPVVGTPFQLMYRSDRVKGTPLSKAVDVEVASDITGITTLKEILVKASIAGQSYSQSFNSFSSYMSASIPWDGNDVYGRPVFGSRNAKIDVTYRYPGVYVSYRGGDITALSSTFGRIAPDIGLEPVTTDAGVDFFLTRQINTPVISYDSRIFGLGGWTLSHFHFYSPISQTLYRGDGSSTVLQQKQTVDTIAGGITWDGNGEVPGADGTPAVNAYIGGPTRVRVAPNGEIYIADISSTPRILKIDRQGLIYTIIGGGTQSFSEGMLAIDFNPVSDLSPYATDITAAVDGQLYIAFGGRVVRVDSSGRMYTVAGDGTSTNMHPQPGDGGSAKNAKFGTITEIDFGPDGSLYIVDAQDNRIRRVTPEGVILPFAGNGASGAGGDGGLAVEAQLSVPMSMTVSKDGVTYIADQANNRIRRVLPDGKIELYIRGDIDERNSIRSPKDIMIAPDGALYTLNQVAVLQPTIVLKIDADKSVTRIAGTDFAGFNGDGLQATETRFNAPLGLAIHPDGSLLVADTQNNRVRRIRSVMPAYSGDNIRIASSSGDEYYFFSALGLHLETRDALTSAIKFKFDYNGNNQLIRIHDVAGNVTEIQRDGNGDPTAIVSPYGQITQLTINSNGYLQAVRNPNNETHELAYDGDTGLLLSFKDPRSNTTSFEYDARGRLIRETRPNSGILELLRTELTRPRLGYEILMSMPEGEQRQYLVEALEDGTSISRQTYSDGSQPQFGLKEGVEVRVTRDTAQIESTRKGDPIFGYQSSYESAQTVSLPSGLTTSISRTKAAQYTENNFLPIITFRQETENINGRSSTMSYNGVSRTMTYASPLNRLNQINLDSLGRVSSAQTANLAAVSLSYDARGRVQNITQGVRQQTFSYDANGYLDGVTNAISQTTQYQNDPVGRVTMQEFPDGRQIHFSYDANGNLASVTPPGKPIHQLYYSTMNLLSEYLPPDLAIPRVNTLYTYNKDNKLSSINRPDLQVANYIYDNQTGHLKSIVHPLGGNGFLYKPKSNLVQTASSYDGVIINYAYDGSLTTDMIWSGAITGSINWQYNANHEVVSESINGQGIGFNYDNDGLLTVAGSETLTYDPVNGLLTNTQLSSLSESYGYNSFGETTSYSTNGLSIQYTRDDLGRIVTKRENLLGGPQIEFSYFYDSSGRLTEVKQNGSTTASYTFDGNSNRLTRNSITATYDAQDRMLTYGTNQYTYTANGEIATRHDNATKETTVYTYDVFGNLKTVILPNGKRIDYLVDAQNRRVGKKVNGTLTQSWIYKDQLNPVAELDGSGQIIARYVYGSKSNAPDYMIKSGVTYKIISDHLGGPRLIVRVSDGTIMQAMNYNELGMATSDSNPGYQMFGFAGGIYDPDTELVRFGARDYDPETGRWTSKEPLLFYAPGTNLYQYSLNDPINYIDSDGKNPFLAAIVFEIAFDITTAVMEWRNGNRNILNTVWERSPIRNVVNTGTDIVLGPGAAPFQVLLDPTTHQTLNDILKRNQRLEDSLQCPNPKK